MAQQQIAANLVGADKRPDRSFYIAWIFLTTLCLPVAFILDLALLRIIIHFVGDMISVNGVEHITEDYLGLYPFIPIAGLVMGAVQYWLLRRYLPHMALWVAVTTAGWIVGSLLAAIVGRLPGMDDFQLNLAFLLLGLSIGTGQWLVLRRRLPAAGWWIVASLLGWALLLLFRNGNGIDQLGLLMVGLLPACTTAAALALLMKKVPGTEPLV